MEELLQVKGIEEKRKAISPKFLSLNIEGFLKYGGIVFIIISILTEITNIIYSLTQNAQLRNAAGWDLFAVIMGVAYSIGKDILWGIFYIALGRIIQLLKKGTIYEQES